VVVPKKLTGDRNWSDEGDFGEIEPNQWGDVLDEREGVDEEAAGPGVGGPPVAGETGCLLNSCCSDFLGDGDVRVEIEGATELEAARVHPAMKVADLGFSKFQVEVNDVGDREDFDFAEDDLERFHEMGFFGEVIQGFRDLTREGAGRQDGDVSVRKAPGIEVETEIIEERGERAGYIAYERKLTKSAVAPTGESHFY
jgi:hypothetical protein